MPTPSKGYFLADGTRVPGTTTIVGRFKDAGGLIHWAWTLGRDGRDYRDERDNAANVGTMIHEQADAAIHKREIPACPESFTAEQRDQVRRGFEAFWSWYQNTVTDIAWTERQLVSETHRFGGTPDAYGHDKQGRGCLFDWKSGGIYQDALIQVGGGYSLLLDEHGHEHSGGIHIVRFGKDTGDFVHRYYPELAVARRQFLLLREAYEHDKVLNKRAK